MESLAQVFAYLNDIDFSYVVLRNFDNLPHNVQLGEHGDLDLLVYDLPHFEEVFAGHLERVYPKPRVQYKLKIGKSYVQTDLRHIGDGYYPYEFQEALLKHRSWNKKGFWTPDPIMHRIALSYHAVHHKNYISAEYRRWLGNIKLEQLAETLKASSIGWEQPDDLTVGSYNSYVKGATGVVSKNGQSVKKTQYRFKDKDLLKNEADILRKLDSIHFPKLVSARKDEIEIEDCGEVLTEKTIPANWEGQLYDIMRALKKFGIVHRDIRIENIMVKDKIMKLIDFGWSTVVGDENSKAPDLLGHPNKAPWGFDDAFSMGKVIKQINARLEEPLVV